MCMCKCVGARVRRRGLCANSGTPPSGVALPSLRAQIKCPEFDVMEANRHAFHTTVHHMFEQEGEAAGLGGARLEVGSC